MDGLAAILSPYHQVGLVAGPATTTATALPTVGAISARGEATPPPWSPDNPLFWFGLVLGVTFGLVGASTSLKVGPFKAAVSAGETK